MDEHTLDLIRTAINDTATPHRHEDTEIENIYELLNGNLYRTIYHLLLADALAIEDPVPPAVPTLNEPPKFPTNLVVQTWSNYNSALLEKFSQEMALYRAQTDLNRARMDLLRALAETYKTMQEGY